MRPTILLVMQGDSSYVFIFQHIRGLLYLAWELLKYINILEKTVSGCNLTC